MTGVGGPASAAVFVHWGVLQISLANLGVIAVMVGLFVLALLLPFPHGGSPGNSTGLGEDGRPRSGGVDEGH